MELGGFEPPTSWVRSSRAKSGRQLQESVISRVFVGLGDRIESRRFFVDTQGYAAIRREWALLARSARNENERLEPEIALSVLDGRSA